MEHWIWPVLVIALALGFAQAFTLAALHYAGKRIARLEAMHGVGEGGDVRTHPHTCTRP